MYRYLGEQQENVEEFWNFIVWFQVLLITVRAHAQTDRRKKKRHERMLHCEDSFIRAPRTAKLGNSQKIRRISRKTIGYELNRCCCFYLLSPDIVVNVKFLR